MLPRGSVCQCKAHVSPKLLSSGASFRARARKRLRQCPEVPFTADFKRHIFKPVDAPAVAVDFHITEEGSQARAVLKSALSSVKSFGLYGVQAAELQRVKAAVVDLEAHNPLQDPTHHLDLLAGTWTVLFSTIKITGWRRVQLGLRDLVQIDQLTQEVDHGNKTAENRVRFSVPAFGIRNGELILTASFEVESRERVSIKLQGSSLVPSKLQKIFESNFDLLLSIFNPEGHLDITYCDDELRCGRDDKGNIFVLQRTA